MMHSDTNGWVLTWGRKHPLSVLARMTVEWKVLIGTFDYPTLLTLRQRFAFWWQYQKRCFHTNIFCRSFLQLTIHLQKCVAVWTVVNKLLTWRNAGHQFLMKNNSHSKAALAKSFWITASLEGRGGGRVGGERFVGCTNCILFVTGSNLTDPAHCFLSYQNDV